MMELNRFADTAAYTHAAADAVTAALADVLREAGSAVLAVPGGSTARDVLPRIASASLDWRAVTVTLTDERWVPPDRPDSNEGLVRRLLAPKLTCFAGLFIAASTPERALRRLTIDVPRPDVILLGMGADGHIASLFPGDPANDCQEPLAVVSRPDHVRMTITPKVIRSAAHVVLATAGRDKLAAIERGMAPGSATELPVRHAFATGARIIVCS